MKKIFVTGFIFLCVTSFFCSYVIAKKKTIKESRQHPYLYFNMEDIPGLRRAAATTHKRYFDDLKKWADKFIDFDPLPVSQLPSNIDIMQIYCENSMSYIFNMSLIYQLTGDVIYLKSAKRWLLEFATYPSEIKGNFCVGAYATAIASGYDMLYNELDPSDRNRISSLLAAVIERGKKGAVSDWWAGIALNHDHWLPLAGLGVGAAALYYENDNAPGWVDYFVDILKTDMNIVGDDGAWTEGTADWVYAISLPFVFYDVYNKMPGVNMFKLPMVKNGIPYRMYNRLPDNTYIYHHDSFANGRYNVLGAVSSHLLHKLAMEHKDGNIQWLANKDEILDLKDLNDNKAIKNDWHLSKSSLVPYLHCVGWNFLWFDAKVKPVPPDNLPLNRYFSNQGLVILRSGWKASDVVFSYTCAPVGGHNARKAVLEGNKKILSNFGHTHAQANAFDLYAYGTYLAVPPSYGSLESNFHNTLTIEGAIQQRNPIFDARLLKTDLQKDYSYLLGDATHCYPSSINLNRWYRHTAFLPPKTFIIADELKSSQPSSSGKLTTWHIDFNTEFTKASIDSVRQTIKICGKSVLQADMLYPSKITFENKKVSWAARQVNASVKDIFSSGPDQQILAVLTAMENDKTKASATRLIKDESIIGAVIDNDNSSRAAIFTLNSSNPNDSYTRKFELVAQAKTTFYMFSLLPDCRYDISVSSKPSDNGLIIYNITVQKGNKFKSNAEGTMIIILDNYTKGKVRELKG